MVGVATSSQLESFVTTTANLSALLVGSLIHNNSPAITATHVLGQLVVGGCIDSKGLTPSIFGGCNCNSDYM